MPTPPIITTEDAVQLNAYLDGELDVPTRLAFERQVAANASLREEHDRLAALRQALAAGLTKDVASDRLRARITALANTGTTATAVRPVFDYRRFEWRQIAATAIVAAGLSSLMTYQLVAPDHGAVASASIVAVHQHALLAANPVDVVSSDRHTVKPWFDSHLALSPPVVDLAADGFPLLGGRIDLVDGRSVPVMIYRRREHLVSLVASPEPGGNDTGQAAVATTRDGFRVLSWRGTDFTFSAISDLAPAELEAFATRLRASL